jgi:two-component system response regulator LytT
MTRARIAGKLASTPAERTGGHTAIAEACALVIDDEAPARDELSYLLRTTFPIAPVHAAQNSSDAFRYLQERCYDMVFCDIRMPELNGIELGNVLRGFAVPPALVFVTAYEEYAVRAFDIGACASQRKDISHGRSALGTGTERRRRQSRSGRVNGQVSDVAVLPRFSFCKTVGLASIPGV